MPSTSQGVERFSLEYDGRGVGRKAMYRMPRGTWVRFDDYARLEAALSQEREKREAALEFVTECVARLQNAQHRADRAEALLEQAAAECEKRADSAEARRIPDLIVRTWRDAADLLHNLKPDQANPGGED